MARKTSTPEIDYSQLSDSELMEMLNSRIREKSIAHENAERFKAQEDEATAEIDGIVAYLEEVGKKEITTVNADDLKLVIAHAEKTDFKGFLDEHPMYWKLAIDIGEELIGRNEKARLSALIGTLKTKRGLERLDERMPESFMKELKAYTTSYRNYKVVRNE